MIPQVKLWTVTIMSDGKAIGRESVYAPTKFLAGLNFRFDYPQYWGTSIRIGLSRKKS